MTQNKTVIFSTTSRIVSGIGCIETIHNEAKRLGISSVLLVTDPGLVVTGIIDRIEKILWQNKIKVTRFDQVEADPPYELADQVLRLLVDNKTEGIVGVGGGSSLDIAKIVSVMATNEIPVSEMFGIDTIERQGLPMILVPTTAGTGSEVTPIVILSDHGEKLKKGVVSPYLYPNTSMLDPELTIGLPPAITAATGMDALIHALEAYTSRNATTISDMLAREAIELINSSIRAAFADGKNLAAREKMLQGSMLAGMAFANAGVTAVHAFAYPIGAEFHIPHGIANTIMLAPVMEFNYIGNLEKFAQLASMLGVNTKNMSQYEAAKNSVQAVLTLADDLRTPKQLREFGVQEKDIPVLAEGVMKVTRLLANNPRELEIADAEAIYRAVL